MPDGVSGDVAALADAAARLLQAGDFPAGLRACRAALALGPGDADLLHMSGIAASQCQRLGLAAVQLTRATAANPGSAPATRHLITVLSALGRRGEEAKAYRALLRLDPTDIVTLVNFGATLLASGAAGHALPLLRRAAALHPETAEVNHTLAEALAGTRRRRESLDAARRAIAIRADFPEALNGLGIAYRHAQRTVDAIASLRRAVELRPDYAEAQNNLGNALHTERRIAEAAGCYRRSIALKPADSAPHMNLGNARMDQGDTAAGTIGFRRVLAIDPGHSAAHSNLIFALDFATELGFAEHQAERRRWYERHAPPFTAMQTGHANDRTPRRRLKVGFVSGDFRQHATASVFAPVMHRLDRAEFEIGCYSTVVREDAVTESLRAISSFWRPVLELTPAELVDMIRRDGIDILVDLSGHTGGNRLLAFAAKPAPVQVTAWGHGTGTGIPAIDYFLSDPIVMPPAVRPLLAEQVYDLPCFMTSTAPEDAPAVAPADERRPFTFGSFNRAQKIGEETAAAWGRILAAMPEARLLLKDPSLDDDQARREMAERLARHGISPLRIEMRGRTPRSEHMGAYGDVDLALDPFPYNGGVSTFEAIYMGVPVVASLGTVAPGRTSAAILTAAGLSSWFAANTDGYVAMAVARAHDRATLAALRPRLRGQLLASEMGDVDRYTAAVGRAFRVMWQRWCKS